MPLRTQTARRLAAALVTLALASARTVHAQQDGLVALPNVYRVQFENPWVRVVHVRIPGNAELPAHSHPPGVMLHVYLTDAEPIVFEHDGYPHTITRPRVRARSYRIGRATPEAHAVFNEHPGASEYLRIELHTHGDDGSAERVPAPPLGAETKASMEVRNSMYRTTRITVAARQTYEIAADSIAPSLLVALTDGAAIDSGGRTVQSLALGDVRFIDVRGRETIRNNTERSVELLRVEFLTRPSMTR